MKITTIIPVGEAGWHVAIRIDDTPEHTTLHRVVAWAQVRYEGSDIPMLEAMIAHPTNDNTRAHLVSEVAKSEDIIGLVEPGDTSGWWTEVAAMRTEEERAMTVIDDEKKSVGKFLSLIPVDSPLHVTLTQIPETAAAAVVNPLGAGEVLRLVSWDLVQHEHHTDTDVTYWCLTSLGRRVLAALNASPRVDVAPKDE